MREKRTIKGITLIDLLLIMLITGQLVAVLAPAFVSAKDKANMSKCMSNLKEIGSAYQLYLQSNDNKWPTLYWTPYHPILGTTWVPTTAQIYADPKHLADGWVSMVDPYIRKRNNVCICPSNTYDNGTSYKVTNYAMNAWLGFTNANTYGNALYPNYGRSNSEISQPGSLICTTEGSNWDWGCTFTPSKTGWYLPVGAQGADAGSDPRMVVVHNNGVNVIWCDWHVSWVEVHDLKPSMWFPTYSP